MPGESVMTLQPFLVSSDEAGKQWEVLGAGGPTIWALASLCSRALSGVTEPGESLSPEAKAILFVAQRRGLIEIKGTYTAFERAERLLAVHVEQEGERETVFRSRTDPRFTIRCLEGFRQLCASGLVMHHLYGEFTLTERGFQVASTVALQEVQHILDEVSVHD